MPTGVSVDGTLLMVENCPFWKMKLPKLSALANVGIKSMAMVNARRFSM
jgi:hypothetical protein